MGLKCTGRLGPSSDMMKIKDGKKERICANIEMDGRIKRTQEITNLYIDTKVK